MFIECRKHKDNLIFPICIEVDVMTQSLSSGTSNPWGACFAMAEAASHFCPELTSFCLTPRPVDGRKEPAGISDLAIQHIAPKKPNCFKDIKLYFQFCVEAVRSGELG